MHSIFVHWATFLSILTLVKFPSLARAYSGFVPEQVPNPMKYPQVCGRDHNDVVTSAICDIDKVLTTEDKDMIEGRINLWVEKHQGLAEFGVCIVRKMSHHYINGAGDVDEAAKKFGEAVHTAWGVGDSKKNNGILIFLSIEDRIVYISRGDGIQGKLTSRALDQVINNMRPHLRDHNFGTAIQGAVVEVELILSDSISSLSSNDPTSISPHGTGDWQNLIYIIFMFVVIAAIVLCNNKKDTRGLQRGQDRMQTLMREVTAANEGSSESLEHSSTDNHFPSSSCPICLDDFPPQSSIGESSEENAQASPAQTNQRRAMELRCGHQFCFQCLERYLKSPDGGRCPICRNPVDPRDPAPSHRCSRPSGTGTGTYTITTSAQSREHSDASGGSSSCGRSLLRNHRPEVRYRLQRMRTLYPDVMTADIYQSVQAAVENGETDVIVRQLRQRTEAVTRIISDRQKAAKAKTSGSSGSSSRSFGGGRSSGGRGGRW